MSSFHVFQRLFDFGIVCFKGSHRENEVQTEPRLSNGGHRRVFACYLFWCGEVGSVGACAVLGRGAAGDLIGIWKWPTLHLCQHTFLIQVGLKEASVTIKFHQVEDLLKKDRPSLI